ncbi:MAG TPA: PAS domain-containing protein [Kofleriaceae bacterium]
MTSIRFPTSFADFEARTVPGVVCELDGTVVALNAAGAQVLARPVSAVIGRKAWEFAPGLEHVWVERIKVLAATGPGTSVVAVATAAGARAIEHAVAVCELDGRTYLVAFATGVKPIV